MPVSSVGLGPGNSTRKHGETDGGNCITFHANATDKLYSPIRQLTDSEHTNSKFIATTSIYVGYMQNGSITSILC